ncbi:MAG TPA: hypothetical protein VFF79_02115 [Conexibacter sp.]|jgi:hypothetical protein|nr:hypothetical protein [Conexibacter sp.]
MSTTIMRSRSALGTRGEVFELVPRSLTEANPGYRDIDEIVRLFAPGAPIHIAAHWIEAAAPAPARDYSCAHVHDDLVEVNILLGAPGELVYSIVLAEGEEPTIVESPSAVVVAAGVAHSANVLRGRGWFVVLRLAPAAMADAGGS